MPYSAIDIANYFVKKALDERKPLTPMQVIKLTYLAHGWHLGIYEKPLINEPVQAWKYGPVIPSIYYTFNGFGKEPITHTSEEEICSFDPKTRELLDKVYAEYSRFEGGQLSTITHADGSPWEEITRPHRNRELPPFLPIPDEVIKAYYQKLANGH